LLEGHDYKSVFQVLKQNYWGTDGTSGTIGAESGPHIVLMDLSKISILERIFVD
jgi:hypothetical protein